MTKSKIFLFSLIAFIAGVAARSFMFVPYAAVWLGAIGAVTVFAVGISRKERAVWISGLFFAAVLLGIFRYDMVERVRPDLSRWYGAALGAEGIVWQEPEQSQNAARMKVRIIGIDGARLERPFFVLATVRRFPHYQIGDALRLEGVIERPENFGEFDYISHLARDSVFAVMAFPEIEKTGEGQGPRLATVLARVKNAFEANIDAVLPEPHAAFLKGLTLGDRESLPSELVEQFRRTGTSHIVALSGYNITMIGRFFSTALLAATAPFQLTFWISTSAIVLFVLLTGASASVVRAGIMGVLVLVAEKGGRLYQMRNALAFAGAAMIFHNPYVLRFDAGFQLSFLATLGLVYLSPHVENAIPRLRSKPDFGHGGDRQALFPLRRTLIETLSAQLAVLPLLIYLFGQISMISPLVNVMVLVAVPYAMTAGFITGGLGFVSHLLSQAAGWINWLLLEYILRVIGFSARIPFAAIEAGGVTLTVLAGMYFWFGWRIWKRPARI